MSASACKRVSLVSVKHKVTTLANCAVCKQSGLVHDPKVICPRLQGATVYLLCRPASDRRIRITCLALRFYQGLLEVSTFDFAWALPVTGLIVTQLCPG